VTRFRYCTGKTRDLQKNSTQLLIASIVSFADEANFRCVMLISRRGKSYTIMEWTVSADSNFAQIAGYRGR